MKAILPHKILINTKHSYQMFRKNQSKISLKLEIDQDNHSRPQSRIPRLLKIFKTLKYIHDLNLSNLALFDRKLYLPKMIYFAKRMSNAQTIKICDHSKSSGSQKGISESWPKYARRIETLSYNNVGRNAERVDEKVPTYISLFTNLLLRYQPRITDLSVNSLHDMSHFIQNYCRHRDFPPSLERISLDNITFNKPIAPRNSTRLRNIKHFEMKSTQMFAENSIVSIIEPLSELCPGLQSLSLCWNYSPTSKILSLFSGIKAFQHLKNLKVQLGSMTTKNLREILQRLAQCSLTELNLKLGIKEESQLLPIAKLIEKQSNLQSLKLQINCEKRFTALEYIKISFKAIDDLLHLVNLSISITSRLKKGFLFSELHPAFTKVFAKQIPLESFRLHIEHLSISNQEFLDIFQSLEPAAPTLKKLTIDIGKTKLKKAERQGLLDLLQNLQNIRSLKLKSLVLSSELLLNDFTEIICSLSSLRSLTLKEISAKVQKQIFVDLLKEILQKPGLEKFECSVSYNLGPLLQQSFQLATVKNIRKRNPSLVQVSNLAAFNTHDEYKIRTW